MKKPLMTLLALIMLSACTRTISYPQMELDQAELIRNNWDNVKTGMTKAQVTNLLGQPSTYRMNYTTETEKLWYVFNSIKDSNKNFYISVLFRDGRLEDKSLVTGSTLFDRIIGTDSKKKAPEIKSIESTPSETTKQSRPVTPPLTTLSPGKTRIITWDFSLAKSGPGDNYPEIATFRKGDKLSILEQSGEWVKVRSENDQVGWIRKEVLE